MQLEDVHLGSSKHYQNKYLDTKSKDVSLKKNTPSLEIEKYHKNELAATGHIWAMLVACATRNVQS